MRPSSSSRRNPQVSPYDGAPSAHPQGSRAAFTLIELLVVIAIIAILAAILFPVFAQAREKARQTACLSNTKQLGMGIMQYVQDYDETLPIGGHGAPGVAANRWYKMTHPYVKNVDVLTCLSKTDGAFRPKLNAAGYPGSIGGYGGNVHLMDWKNYETGTGVGGRSLAAITDVAGTFIVCDAARLTDAVFSEANLAPDKWNQYQRSPSDWQVNPPGAWDKADVARYSTAPDQYGNQVRRPVPRHAGGLNIIYADGHAKWSRITQFLGIPQNGVGGWPYGHPNNSWDNK